MAATLYENARERPQGGARRGSRAGHIVRVLIVVVLVGVLGFGLWWFNNARRHGIADFFAHNVPPPAAVTAVPVEVGPLGQYLGGIGTVVAVRQVNVAPEVAGRVVGIGFEPGSVVKAGDPLVQINDEPERADLANYQAQQRLAEANLARTQTLATQSYATKATLDQNAALLDEAKAWIVRTQAVIAQKQIKAPFAGQLGMRQVNLGQYVSVGTALVTLTDLDKLYVNFTVPEQARGRVQVGQTVEVTADAFPGRTFTATLTTIEPQVDPNTRAIKLQATLDNPEHHLLPGMFANARVVLPAKPEVVTVPETAVAHTLYGDSVFVVREEGQGQDGKPQTKAVQTFVHTGEVADGRVAILDGLKPGDLVVSSGNLKLQNGSPVRVAADEALAKPARPPVE
jgi:multidrug efflux system membrane fusion protein